MSKNYVVAGDLGSLNTATMLVPGQNYPISDTFAFPASIIRIINRSNIDVVITYTTESQDNLPAVPKDLCPAGGTIQLDFQTNSQPNNQTCLMPKGTVIYGASPVAGVGSIYATYYGQIN